MIHAMYNPHWNKNPTDVTFLLQNGRIYGNNTLKLNADFARVFVTVKVRHCTNYDVLLR